MKDEIAILRIPYPLSILVTILTNIFVLKKNRNKIIILLTNLLKITSLNVSKNNFIFHIFYFNLIVYGSVFVPVPVL